ncbi:hypothetical protein DRO59_00090 [Candidatus Bathyarchaeota archaeon]|nr:MAG: hypothetical protein DRO59_00090 [Candidatus Bathyarchaeota archaeon]
MTEVTKGSITVTFRALCVAEPGHGITAELDAERNEGKHCFTYGEKVYFRVYTYPQDMRITLTSSDGSINMEGSGIETIEDEMLTFADTKEASTHRYIRAIVSYNWLGASLGQVTCIGGSAIVAAKEGCAVLRLTYTSFYRVYSITVPPRDYETYLVLILIKEVGEKK